MSSAGHDVVNISFCRQYTHKHCTFRRSTVSTQARNASHALGSRIAQHLCAPEKNLSSGPHMSHQPFTTSTASSSLTLPSTTTPEHALQSGQHDPLQECPVHHRSAIKNHSGVKTSRVAETRAQQLPQVVSPKNLNQFERFRVFLGLISRFEFEFRRYDNYFFERFEFLVCSKFNHTHHVAVNVCVLWPVCAHNNSLSNVVASVTIDS